MGIEIVGANIIEKNDKILFVKESKDRNKRYNLPGGKLEYNESIIDCAKREGKEETGLEIEPKYIVGIYQRPNSFEKTNTTFIVFYSEIISGHILETKKHPEVSFFDYNRISDLEKKGMLRSRYIIPAIDDYLEGKKIGLENLEAIF